MYRNNLINTHLDRKPTPSLALEVAGNSPLVVKTILGAITRVGACTRDLTVYSFLGHNKTPMRVCLKYYGTYYVHIWIISLHAWGTSVLDGYLMYRCTNMRTTTNYCSLLINIIYNITSKTLNITDIMLVRPQKKYLCFCGTFAKFYYRE